MACGRCGSCAATSSPCAAGQADAVAGEFPQEVAPLAEELNLLIGANREIVERARIQVGNLAHALKTPLSVIVNEARCRGHAARPQGRRAGRGDARPGRSSISTAPAPRPGPARSAPPPTRPTALAAMARAFGKIYPAIDLAVDCPENLRFRGEKQDFDDMAGNLIDNACKWATREVRVSVEELPAERPATACSSA